MEYFYYHSYYDDYFLYHNRSPGVAANCTAHVDRGVLVAISLTDVPGLEVRSGGRWVCPEAARGPLGA